MDSWAWFASGVDNQEVLCPHPSSQGRGPQCLSLSKQPGTGPQGLCPGVATAGSVGSQLWPRAVGTRRVLRAAPLTAANKSKGTASSMSFLESALPVLTSSHLASESPRFLSVSSLIVYAASSAFSVLSNTKSVVYFPLVAGLVYG